MSFGVGVNHGGHGDAQAQPGYCIVGTIAEQGGQQADQAQQAGGQEEGQAKSADDAVDAEFEEVKDDDKR